MIFLPFYSLSWILLCCLDEIFTMALTPFLCNLSNVCLEMFRSSGAENPLLQPAFAGDYSSHWYVLKEIHQTTWRNGSMVSTLEIFCECDRAKPLAQRWKAAFCFYERGKNTKGVEQLFEVRMFELQVTREVKVLLPLCFFSVPRKSIFGVKALGFLMMSICWYIIPDHSDFAALPLWRAFLSMGLKSQLFELSR